MRQVKAGVRQIKVSPAFSKAAVGKAEPYGLTRRSRWKRAAQAAHAPKAVAAGAGAVAPCLLFPQAKLRSLGQNNRGTYVPPFFGVWEGRTYGPCNPLRVTRRCLALCKPFEKGLSENFTCLHRTQARAACQPPPANPGAIKRRSRLVQSGHGLDDLVGFAVPFQQHPPQGTARCLTVTNGQSQGVGGVVWLGNLGQVEQPPGHLLHLGL